jgi:hypothetical protein
LAFPTIRPRVVGERTLAAASSGRRPSRLTPPGPSTRLTKIHAAFPIPHLRLSTKIARSIFLCDNLKF